MKRLICLMLVWALALAAAGCGGAAEQPGAPETVDEASAGAAAPQPEAEDSGGVLVVYFSATGTTRAVAERIAGLTAADVKEIVPAQPYSAGDLNYNDPASRATVEQNDATTRPEIAEDVSLDGYTTVYLGYPIWWGQAPRIMSTFVESQDFTGVTVIPFCTSGSSDIGQSDDALAAQAGSGNWLQGRRFAAGVSDDELRAWIDETGEDNVAKALKLSVAGSEVSVAWEENASVQALAELVQTAPLTVRMATYGGFEQVGPLGASLPRDDVQTTTQAGDIVLYSGDQIVVFYGANSWDYTRLGRITDRSPQQLEELLGQGYVTITLSWE